MAVTRFAKFIATGQLKAGEESSELLKTLAALSIV